MVKKFIKTIAKKIFYKLYFYRLKVEMFLEKRSDFINQSVGCDGKNILEVSKKEQLNAIIAEVYEDRDGIVTIVSDDGFYESGVLLNKLAQKYNIRVTVAGTVAIVKPYLEQWKKIIEEGYLEMVSHSYRHVALKENSELSRDNERLYHEIVGSARWHEKNFPKIGKQITYVWPEGEACKKGNEILEKNGFYAVRKVLEGYNSLSPKEGTEAGSWFGLKVFGIGDESVSTELRNQWVLKAAQDKLWLIEMWHNVTEEQDGYYETILREKAEEHLSYIAQKQKERSIWVATFTDATKYIREKQNAYPEVHYDKNSIYARVVLKDINLSKNIFNYPLTIKIQLPEECRGNSFYLGKLKLPVDREGNLLVNIVPDGRIVEIVQIKS